MWPIKNNKTQEESFSYTNQAKDSTTIAVLGVEFVVIVVIVVLVFGVLNYFLIFPLSVMNPKLFGWMPTTGVSHPHNQERIAPIGYALHPNEPIIRPEPTIDTRNLKHTISVVSENPAYEISMSHSEELISAFGKWGLYGKAYNFGGERGSTHDAFLYTVVIHFTDQPQILNVTTVENQVAFSSDVKASPAKIDIYVYLAPFVLNGEKKYTLDKGEYFDDEMLGILYKLSHQTNSPDEQRALNIEMAKEARSLKNIYKNFVTLTKK